MVVESNCDARWTSLCKVYPPLVTAKFPFDACERSREEYDGPGVVEPTCDAVRTLWELNVGMVEAESTCGRVPSLVLYFDGQAVVESRSGELDQVIFDSICDPGITPWELNVVGLLPRIKSKCPLVETSCVVYVAVLTLVESICDAGRVVSWQVGIGLLEVEFIYAKPVSLVAYSFGEKTSQGLGVD